MQLLIFLLVLSVLVLVHELGHFFVAKKFGVLVEEFGFGIPPRLFGKKIGETIYSINLFPFGGFVRLHGESSGQKVEFPGRSFSNLNKRKKSAIVVAGVVMNTILAILCFAIFYSFSGIPKSYPGLKVVEIAPGSPISESGVVVDDVILKINETEVSETSEFISLVNEQKGKEISLTVVQGGNENTVLTTPRENPPEGEGSLGVVISPNVDVYFPPLLLRPFYGIYYGVLDSWFWAKAIVVGIGTIFGQLFSGSIPQDVAGPVGIYAVTAQAASFGILTLINFVGILSLNLGVLNILPFPALDGGRLIFFAFEGLTGKKVSPKVESWVHGIGMLILLAALLAITVGDIRKLIQFGGVDGFLESIAP